MPAAPWAASQRGTRTAHDPLAQSTATRSRRSRRVSSAKASDSTSAVTATRGGHQEPAFEEAAFLERVAAIFHGLDRDYIAQIPADGEIDWITVTSSNTAKSLVRLYGDALRNAKFASISPLTTTALKNLGFRPAAEASPHTTAALVDAILRDGQTDG